MGLLSPKGADLKASWGPRRETAMDMAKQAGHVPMVSLLSELMSGGLKAEL
jgi:hypothetical protein